MTDQKRTLKEITPPPCVIARYSQKSFPSYRHVPGLHPHPVANPQGHSFNPTGAHPQAAPWLPPERWRESEDYLYGVDLYNHGYWWEAHEAWEGLWQQTDKAGPQGRFIQGLIQVSAAHLKRHVNQPEGMDRLLDRAFQHLSAARSKLNTPEYMGLNIDAFTHHVQQYFADEETTFPAIILSV